jgi:hypothetical protein
MANVEVKPSRIEGLGVFATRPFHASERIRRVNVIREVTQREYRRLLAPWFVQRHGIVSRCSMLAAVCEVATFASRAG